MSLVERKLLKWISTERECGVPTGGSKHGKNNTETYKYIHVLGALLLKMSPLEKNCAII